MMLSAAEDTTVKAQVTVILFSVTLQLFCTIQAVKLTVQ